MINNKRNILILIIAVLMVVAYLKFEYLWNLWSPPKIEDVPIAEVDVSDYAQQAGNAKNKSPGSIIISDSLNEVKFPERVPIYRYDDSGFDKTFDNPKKLAQRFGFQDSGDIIDERNDPVLGRTVVFSEGNKTLYVYYGQRQVFYYVSVTKDLLKLGLNTNPDAYKTKADEILQTVGLHDETFEYTNYAFMSASGSETVLVNDPWQAHIVEIIYQARIDGIPVVDADVPVGANTISIQFDRDMNLLKLDYQWIGKMGAKITTVNLKTLDELKNNITEGKAKFVYSDTISLEQIQNTSINSAQLAYYAINDYLVPVYLLKGTSTVFGQKEADGYFVIKATK